MLAGASLVLGSHSITPTLAPADVREATHPAPIRWNPEGITDPTTGEWFRGRHDEAGQVDR